MRGSPLPRKGSRRQKRGPPNPHRLRHGPRWSYQFATLVYASPRPTCCGPKAQRDPAHPTSGFDRLDAFDGTRNFLFARLRKADQQGNFEVNTDNIVKLDAPVRFPALWSRKALPPEPVEAYREQPQRFPPVWGFKDYDWVEWTIDTNTVIRRDGLRRSVAVRVGDGPIAEKAGPIEETQQSGVILA